MKIAVISTCFPRKSNLSNGIFIFQQLKALTDLNIECHLIQPVNWFPPLGLHKLHPHWNKGYEDFHDHFNEYKGIKIHKPKVFIKMPSRFFIEEHWERFGKTIARYIKKEKTLKDISLVYSHFLCHEAYAATFVKEELGIPLVAIARGDDVHAWPKKNQKLEKHLKKVFSDTDLLLANSKRLGEDTQKWMSANSIRNVKCIYNGIDYLKFFPPKDEAEKKELRKKFNLPLDKKIIISIGRSVKEKGWVEVMQAISSLGNKFDNWLLVAIAPSGIERNELDLENEAIKYNIQNHFLSIGAQKPDDLPQILRAADAFILASYNEGMSNAVLEALATGLFIITTNVGGHAEIIRNNETGLIIEPQSVTQLIEAITRLINKDYSDAIFDNARQEAIRLGRFEDNSKILVQEFEALLKRSR